jgi:hypothetical protein
MRGKLLLAAAALPCLITAPAHATGETVELTVHYTTAGVFTCTAVLTADAPNRGTATKLLDCSFDGHDVSVGDTGQSGPVGVWAGNAGETYDEGDVVEICFGVEGTFNMTPTTVTNDTDCEMVTLTSPAGSEEIE